MEEKQKYKDDNKIVSKKLHRAQTELANFRSKHESVLEHKREINELSVEVNELSVRCGDLNPKPKPLPLNPYPSSPPPP